VDWGLLDVAGAFTIQSFVKHLLTEGEKAIFFLMPVC